MADKDKQNTDDGAPKVIDAAADDSEQKSPEELINQINNEGGSLEVGPKTNTVDAMADESTTDKAPVVGSQRKKQAGIRGLLGKINIYFLAFLFLVVASGAAYAALYFMNRKAADVKPLTSTLTEEDVQNLTTSDAIVGDPSQILTIESNAVVTGKLILRDTLDIAGALQVGGSLSAPNIATTGNGSFNSLTTNDYQAAGNATVGGTLDVVGFVSLGNGLSVAGDINGGGRLDVGGAATIGGNLNVNGTISAKGINFDDIALTHINITGTTPGISPGGAAGGGATASVSGTDTAGTATINTGGGSGTGILATITFTKTFSSNNPHPVITPNGSSCASIAFYVTNISSTQFSIATATNPGVGKSCKFNYIVIN